MEVGFFSADAVTPAVTLIASSPAPLLPTLSLTYHSFSRLGNNFSINPKSPSGCNVISPYAWKGWYALIVGASSEGSGTGDPVSLLDSDSDEENISFENLHLEEPKLQLKLEHKMKMKFAKNIRMRRKKLVRKRRMRKKGQWPPYKLKKNKNVQ